METFKLTIAYLISPLSLVLGIQAVGWLLWWRRKRRAAIVSIAVGSFVLLLASLPVLSYGVNRDREYVYGPLDPDPGLDAGGPVLVVVLGTGFNPDPYLPPNSQVSASFLARLLEGVRIVRSREGDDAVSNAQLMVSVAGDFEIAEKRAFLARMVQMLALDGDRVALIGDAESTADEAAAVNARLEQQDEHPQQKQQLVVVTSAGHMPRAMRIFEDAGMEPIAAPADFYTQRAENPHGEAWKLWLPSPGGLGGSGQLVYEWAASVWHAVSGK